MAERYLLGELMEEERSSYEEHMFSCESCFEQIRVGTELVSQIRQLGPEAANPVPGFMSRLIRNVSQPVTAAAFALLICVSALSVYQHGTISKLKQPQVTPSFFLSDGAKAGGIKTLPLSPNTRFDLSIQLLRNGDFSSYEGQILTGSGQLKSAFPVSAEQARDTIHISLDSGTLGPGTYSVVIHGLASDGQKTEIDRYEFQIQSKE